MKASGKGAGKGKGKRSSNNSGTTDVTAGSRVMKFLAPEALAAAIIGKGGAVIAEMRTSCNAKIALTEKSDVYPATDCRVLTASAQEEESLNQVCKQIISKAAELAKAGSASDAVGTEAELKIKTLAPRAAVGGIIGKAGATIKQIRESSGAKISVGEPANQSPGAEQLVTITGSDKAIEYVLQEVNKQIQALSSENWFSSWASSTGVIPAGTLPGMAGGFPMAFSSPGIASMIQVAQSMPHYVMEDSRGFALSCVVPNRLVGGLIGRGGSGTKEIQNMTGTKIGIRDIENDSENRSLNIAGPLANTCSAYMLMMKRYLDAEQQASQSSGQ